MKKVFLSLLISCFAISALADDAYIPSLNHIHIMKGISLVPGIKSTEDINATTSAVNAASAHITNASLGTASAEKMNVTDTVTAADLTATDDLVVGDDGSIGGDLTVSGKSTFSEADSGLGTPNASADTLVLKNNGEVGMTFGAAPNAATYIMFASGVDSTYSWLKLDSTNNIFDFYIGNGVGGVKNCLRLDGDATNPLNVPAGAGNMIADGYDNHSNAIGDANNPYPRKEILDANTWLITLEDVKDYIANHSQDGANHTWRLSKDYMKWQVRDEAEAETRIEDVTEIIPTVEYTAEEALEDSFKTVNKMVDEERVERTGKVIKIKQVPVVSYIKQLPKQLTKAGEIISPTEIIYATEIIKDGKKLKPGIIFQDGKFIKPAEEIVSGTREIIIKTKEQIGDEKAAYLDKREMEIRCEPIAELCPEKYQVIEKGKIRGVKFSQKVSGDIEDLQKEIEALKEENATQYQVIDAMQDQIVILQKRLDAIEAK